MSSVYHDPAHFSCCNETFMVHTSVFDTSAEIVLLYKTVLFKIFLSHVWRRKTYESVPEGGESLPEYKTA